MSSEHRSYRFADARRPGLLLGLGARQAVPLIAAVLWLAGVLQTSLPLVVAPVGLVAGIAVAFGRWRGSPLAEVLVPGLHLAVGHTTGASRWQRPDGPGQTGRVALPRALDGLAIVEQAGPGGCRTVVHDRHAGTITAVIRVHGRGFPLAGQGDQDLMLAAWGAALSPFARERCPVVRVTWQERARPVGSSGHDRFLDRAGTRDRHDDPAVGDYLALLAQQAPATVAHDVHVAVTVDLRRVRPRGRASRWDAAVAATGDELRLLADRLDAAGLTPSTPLDGPALRAACTPTSTPTETAGGCSLAVAAGRAEVPWGPSRLELAWDRVVVDGRPHRSFHIAGWPPLPVGSDWLSGLLIDAHAERTVSVAFEPVALSRAARAADREVMSREADAELKERKGFRVNARERKRLSDAEARERELSEGHAEFQFAGLVTVSAADLDALDEACADVEQAAGQSLLDLRPLDARHDRAWVASLPLGRSTARTAG